jgi:amidase
MPMSSLLLKSARNQAASVRDKTIKSIDLLEAHFAQIDKLNPELNAIIWQDRDAARKTAWEIDQETDIGDVRGPLHGIPMTVKEPFDLTGAPTT